MRPRQLKFALGLAALLAGCVGFEKDAKAEFLDPREIALIMESMLVDLDVAMIAMRNGPDYDAQLKYHSRLDYDAWNGRLYGTYGGHVVDIYYSGTVTDIGGPSNQFDISYTSDWYIDGETTTGSGTAVYTDPPFTFDIDLQNMTVSGSGSLLPGYQIANITLSGTKDLANSTLTVSDTLSVGDIPFVGSAGTLDVTLVYDQVTGTYTSSVNLRALGGWLYQQTFSANSGTIGTPTPAPPAPPARPNPPIELWPEGDPGLGAADQPGFNTMTVESVPEPATVWLLASACIALAGGRRLIRRGQRP